MAFVGFQYESVSLNVNEIHFDEVQDISDTYEKSRKSKSISEWCRCGKYDIMDANIGCLSCGKVEALRYFQLLDMR